MSRERNITFLQNKKIINLCLRQHILRSYRFVVEVTFKDAIKPQLQSRNMKVYRNLLFLSNKSICIGKTS